MTMASTLERIVHNTGCSAGRIGDALAQVFHATGNTRVFANARDTSKLTHFKKLGIETLELDIESKESILECFAHLSNVTGGVLDILVDNSGIGYNRALTDTDHDVARSVFELNVLAPQAVI